MKPVPTYHALAGYIFGVTPLVCMIDGFVGFV